MLGVEKLTLFRLSPTVSVTLAKHTHYVQYLEPQYRGLGANGVLSMSGDIECPLDFESRIERNQACELSSDKFVIILLVFNSYRSLLTSGRCPSIREAHAM